ncbi:MAG: penicillin-binding protein 2 [Clostridia bacterium]|nr:penicillin-binding protein 2 [Clostridia bacterium]
MNKRIIAVFTAFAMVYGICCLRLYTLCVANPAAASNQSGGYTVEVQKIRGDILGCNGEKLVSRDYENIVVAKPTNEALSVLEKVLDSQSYSEAEKRMQSGNAVSVNIGRLEIAQTADAVMLRKYNRYSENQLARHIIGYLDGEGRGVSGIEKSFDSLLFTEKSLSATMKSDVYGRILSGKRIEIRNSSPEIASVMLTVDSRFQLVTENALDVNGVECGGAVVVEIATGAVRACASRPDFDTYNLADSLNDESSPLLNRTLGAYAVGSVFKVAVAAAALEGGINDFYYTCSGSCEVDGITFSCNDKTAHGELDIKKALECSCNTFFIELAKRTGAENILETASLLGFGQEIALAEGIVSKSGVLPTAQKLSSSGALANFSFGQGEFTATLLQLAQMMAAVADGGRYIQPYIIEKVTSADGTVLHTHEKPYPITALSEKTAARLTRMLTSVVENGNAQKARLKNGISAAGKTATAQTGTFKNGKEICNTWFAGFFPADNPQYAVVVLKEGGESGATDCAPVFRSIANKIADLKNFS